MHEDDSVGGQGAVLIMEWVMVAGSVVQSHSLRLLELFNMTGSLAKLGLVIK